MRRCVESRHARAHPGAVASAKADAHDRNWSQGQAGLLRVQKNDGNRNDQ